MIFVVFKCIREWFRFTFSKKLRVPYQKIKVNKKGELVRAGKQQQRVLGSLLSIKIEF